MKTPSPNTIRILIIEDHPEVAAALRAKVQELTDHPVDLVITPVALARKFSPAQHRLILMDYNFGPLRGAALLDWLGKRMQPGTPLVACTNARIPLEQMSPAGPIREVLRKPPSVRAIQAMLELVALPPVPRPARRTKKLAAQRELTEFRREQEHALSEAMRLGDYARLAHLAHELSHTYRLLAEERLERAVALVEKAAGTCSDHICGIAWRAYEVCRNENKLCVTPS